MPYTPYDNIGESSFPTHHNDSGSDSDSDNEIVERERDGRKRKKGKSGLNWRSPWVIGGGITLVIIIGTIIYFTLRKKDPKKEINIKH